MSKEVSRNDYLEYLLKIGAFQGALEVALTGLAENPEDVNLLVYRGRAYSGLGDRPSATEYFQRASERLPQNVIFQIQIARLLCEIGQKEEATEIVDIALENHKNDLSLLVEKGVISIKSYKYEEALYYFNKALEINPDFEPAKKAKEMAIASKNHTETVVGKIERLGKYIAKHCGEEVIAGPFVGMKYPSNFLTGPSKSALAQKLLGCYEKELHAAVFMVMKEKYDVFLNIGCAEGYYTVGLARNFQDTKIIAFDLDETAREDCRNLAEINGVLNQITIKDYCSISELNQNITGRTLIICDIDGSEADLLNPELVPSLRQADMIVELHDIYVKGLSNFMVKRFQATHEVALLSVVPRNEELFPAIAELSFEEKIQAIAPSHPPEMKWGMFLSKEYLTGGTKADLQSNLRLRDVNLVIFPDWSAQEESLGLELSRAIGAMAIHPDKNQITLLIDTTDISSEDADAAISSAVMNLLMSEDLDVDDGPEMTIIGEMSEMQWELLLPRIHSRIGLENENQEAIARVKATNLPCCELDNLPNISFLAS